MMISTTCCFASMHAGNGGHFQGNMMGAHQKQELVHMVVCSVALQADMALSELTEVGRNTEKKHEEVSQRESFLGRSTGG